MYTKREMMSDFEDGESEYYSQHFTNLEVSGQEISAKEFEDCQFKECNFSETQFRNCKFIDCTFIKCNLSNAKVAYSRFSNVDFDECKVIGVDWTRASWSDLALASPLKFTQCILNDSSFFALKLPEIILEGCKAHDVDFREGNFYEGNFSYTDFSNSLFQNTNLQAVDFTEAANYDIDIYQNVIKGAKFSSFEAVRLLASLEIELVD